MKGKPFIICGVPNDKATKYDTTFVELSEDTEYTIYYSNGNWICRQEVHSADAPTTP